MNIINRILATNDNTGSLLLRLFIGIVFIAHGAQKLFGWFGGYGLEATSQWLASIGFEPSYLLAVLAGSAEFFGGIALLLGIATRPAALLTAFTMLIAIFTHLEKGFFAMNGGYEYALILMISSLTLVIQGAGRFSIDSYLARKLPCYRH
ncbi:DoxX family protein [Thalassotalea atypica]|uniref:DoxX family protein n=1 Tax=Thalassotalea atypica TaxID=2054316 RepID=UPI0025746478|nr:DoxX family protein [Thalassotalea atypica]